MTKNCEMCGNPFEAKTTARFCKEQDCRTLRARQRAKKWRDKEESRLKKRVDQRLYRDRTRNLTARNAELKAKYGVDLFYWEAMLEVADYRCEICGKNEDLVLDHCHVSGVPRGVLCRRCNKGLGSLGDTDTLVQKAAAYLKERKHGIPPLVGRVLSEDGAARFEQGCLFTETSGGHSYVPWTSTDQRRVQWHPIWSPPLRRRRVP